jgi:hypothetical protein
MFSLVDGQLRIKAQPERRPDLHRKGAFILLAWTIQAFLEDAKLRRECRGDVKSVTAAVTEFKRRPRFLQTST